MSPGSVFLWRNTTSHRTKGQLRPIRPSGSESANVGRRHKKACLALERSVEDIKLHFLGTAAAEGFPGLFCRCQTCSDARKRGGKDIRTRSSVLIDDVLKIDWPPDTYLHVLREQLDLAAVRDLLVTHTHHDHLVPGELIMRKPVFAQGVDHPLNIYGNELVVRACKPLLGDDDERFTHRLLRPFKTADIGSAVVTPLLADHNPDESCFIYHIKRNGKTLLHGHDSGWFPDETWQWLRENPIDFAVLECTSGPLPGMHNHLNIEGVTKIQQAFLDQGILKTASAMAVTHFSHNSGMLHDDFVQAFEPLGITTAYDGLVLQI